jgi:hypothetical protein
METSSQQTASPFVYSSEETAFKAAKRLKKLFAESGLIQLSVSRAKHLLATCVGYSDWASLIVASSKASKDVMDHDLDVSALTERRCRRAGR